MKETLNLPHHVTGTIWHYQFRGQNLLPHRHDELELNLITKGRATYLLCDSKYSLKPRDSIWLFPAQDHVLLDQSPDFAMWVIVWKPATVAAATMLAANQLLRDDDPAGSFHRHLSQSQIRRLSALCEEIESSDADCRNAGLSYLLLRAWMEFNTTDRIAVGEDVHPCVERAARLLRDGDDMSLQLLARQVGLSPSRLSRLFKAQTGLAISEFRNRRRLDRFFNIYNHGHRSEISEAAFEAGFGSYPQFHRVFKRIVGESPARFMRGGNAS